MHFQGVFLLLWLMAQPSASFDEPTGFDAIVAHWKFEQNLESSVGTYTGSANGTTIYISFPYNNQTYAGYQFNSGSVLTLPSEISSSLLPFQNSWTVAGIFQGIYPDGPLIHVGGLDQNTADTQISLWMNQAGADTLTLRIGVNSINVNCYVREFFFAAVRYNSTTEKFTLLCIRSNLIFEQNTWKAATILSQDTYLTVGHGM